MPRRTKPQINSGDFTSEPLSEVAIGYWAEDTVDRRLVTLPSNQSVVLVVVEVVGQLL